MWTPHLRKASTCEYTVCESRAANSQHTAKLSYQCHCSSTAHCWADWQQRNQKPPVCSQWQWKLLAGSTHDKAWRTRLVGHEPHPADIGNQKWNHQSRTYIFVKKYIKFHWEYMNLICMMSLRDAQRFWTSESNSTAHQRRQSPWNLTLVKRVAPQDAAWSQPKHHLLFHYHTKQAPPSANALPARFTQSFCDDLSNTDVTEKSTRTEEPHSLPNIPT